MWLAEKMYIRTDHHESAYWNDLNVDRRSFVPSRINYLVGDAILAYSGRNLAMLILLLRMRRIDFDKIWRWYYGADSSGLFSEIVFIAELCACVHRQNSIYHIWNCRKYSDVVAVKRRWSHETKPIVAKLFLPRRNWSLAKQMAQNRTLLSYLQVKVRH